MPRFARLVIPGCPHHVTQRGSNRRDVFFVDDDRRVYVEVLREQSEKYALKVRAYCLMSNHAHLIGVPGREESLAKAVGRTHFAYTQYVNRLHGRSGHLWQNRFFSCTVDERHYWEAIRYVERNPVRARILRRAWRYRWSSAAAHCGEAGDQAGVLDLAQWAEESADRDWKAALRQWQDEEMVLSLRLGTSRGRPLGSDGFASKLEKLVGRRLRPLPVGRPRKGGRRGRKHAQHPHIS